MPRLSPKVRFSRKHRGIACALAASTLFGLQGPTLALESTAVLPKGVRNLQLKFVDTQLKDKTNEYGDEVPLSEPLSKDLTFRRALRGEKSDVRRALLRSAMLTGGYADGDSLGRFAADLRGHVQVLAPIFAYGLSDKLTLAVGAPYYRAATEIEVGFQENENARGFLASLTAEERRHFGAAQTAFGKIDGAVGELNKKLRDNGYKELERWDDEGFGDLTVAAKYLAYDVAPVKIASTFGVVAPTGKIDDPDILTDLGFGDGTWDGLLGVTVDAVLPAGFFANAYTKYAHQLIAKRDMRLVTEEEPIEGPTEEVYYKLGDKMNAGASINYAPESGAVAGLGYELYRKFGDHYFLDDRLVRDKYEKDTAQASHRAELLLGYSTVPAFRRKEFAVPLRANLFYSRHLASFSMPNNDLVGMDIFLFF